MTKLNCDMGESFGIYRAGNDEEIMPLIDIANVACGFHASDPNHMRKTVALAKKHGVKVGAHPSFPDLQGFGRREIKMPRQDIKNMIMYQVGALKSFLDEQGMPLNHIKPHGSLYVMAAKDENMAHAIADAVETFSVSIFGMANTCHEKVYKDERGLNFVSEFYADLDYDENGKLVIAKGKNATYNSKIATDRVLRAISEKKVTNTVGKDIDVGCDTICVHSDTPNAVEIIKGIKSVLNR
jgi:5-oxoprolinase (ATP-hydrolysing) subunit A